MMIMIRRIRTLDSGSSLRCLCSGIVLSFDEPQSCSGLVDKRGRVKAGEGRREKGKGHERGLASNPLNYAALVQNSGRFILAGR